MDKPRVFLDSSVIIAALLSSRGASYHILTHSFTVLDLQINEYVYEEVRRSLEVKFADQPELLSNLFSIMGLAGVTTIQNPEKHGVREAEKLLSKKDAPILASALQKSDYLLTLDNGFFSPAVIRAAKQESLEILKPGDFVRAVDA